MEQDDELEQLLGEISPPNLEDLRQRASSMQSVSFFSAADEARLPMILSDDIHRAAYTDCSKPVTTNQMYNGINCGQSFDHRKPQQPQQQQQQQQQKFYSKQSDEGLEDVTEKQQQLASAFSNLSFGGGSVLHDSNQDWVNRKSSNGFSDHHHQQQQQQQQLDSYGGYRNAAKALGLLRSPDYITSKEMGGDELSSLRSSSFVQQQQQQQEKSAHVMGCSPYAYQSPTSWVIDAADQLDLIQAQQQRALQQYQLQRILQQQLQVEEIRQQQRQQLLQQQHQQQLLEAAEIYGQLGSYSRRQQSYQQQHHNMNNINKINNNNSNSNMNNIINNNINNNSNNINKQIQQLAALRMIEQHQQLQQQQQKQKENPTLPGGNLCRYYAQGYCSRGDVCPFVHSPQSKGFHLGLGMKDALGAVLMSPEEKLGLLTRKATTTTTTTTITNARRSPSSIDDASSTADYEEVAAKYNSLDEVEGRIYSIAKDQHGCRFLQKKFDEGDKGEIVRIFSEILEHILDLMTDPFGNYLIQKVLEVADDVQRKQILHAVTSKKKGELVNISLNMHGTRAVQKLIETTKSSDQIAMVTNALKPGVVTLIKDLNGNHVVQRCLQKLSNEDNQFIFDAAASHCVEIATHRHGCCVLQRCVDFAHGAQRHRLVSEIAANALLLSQDQYGNYVVQYILELGMAWASLDVMMRLEGNYAVLAMQKFSSNVVEKCLKQAGEECRSRIVREIMTSSLLGQLLQDPFANYVIQSALSVTKGSVHAALVEAIRPHLPALRSSPYGKRILSRANMKK